MKTKLILFTLIFTITLTTFGQICGTPSYSNENQQQKSSTIKSSNSQYLNNSTSICVSVKYHIVRQTNGTGGFNSSNLINVTNTLNEAYNEHKIYFNNLGYDFINNSTYYDIDDTNNATEFDTLVQINNDTNAINIYIVNSAASYNGKANGILSRELVIDINYAATNVLAHEIGHCLNLWHTFHGSFAEPASAQDPNACSENFNGLNCETCGDYVCDTPADANIGNSGGYNPALDNIMSYYFPFDKLTSGQNTKMRQAFDSSSILQNVISNSCSIPELDGSSIVCNSNTTFTLQNGGTSVTWQVSSNLQIVSSNNSSITVKSQSANSSGQGFIEAILPYETLIQNVWVGKPQSVLSLTHVPTFGCTRGEIEVDSGGAGADQFEWLIVGGTIVIPNVNSNIYTGGGTIFVDPIDGPYGFTVKVRAKNSCGDSEWYTKYIPTDCSGGTPLRSTMFPDNDLILYPNPASQTIFVNLNSLNNENNLNNNEKEYTYELYNLQSVLVKKGKLSYTKFDIDVSNLKKGRYVLKINGTKNEIQHIIVK
ncbi:T9SS type A sorting domain-containing protein [Mariniflexile sp.]|uniref:T9SS type A sorting domain-containing protein n=2 Tax=Mariniflexile sp. TaxID=1979402 RepID=UPI004048067F